MSMVDAQTLTTMFGGIGVGVAAFYYVMMLRNAEKIRARDMIFQKLNVNMIQHFEIVTDVVKMVDWVTVEDLYRKYGRYANPEAYNKWVYLLNHYNALGILLRDRIVEPELVFSIYSPGQIINVVDKLRPYFEFIAGDYWDGVRSLYGEARRLYPEDYLGLPVSLEDELGRARVRDSKAKGGKQMGDQNR